MEGKYSKMPSKSSSKNSNRATTLKFVLLTCVLYLVAHQIFFLYFPKLTPVITIQDGQVQGKVAYSRDGKEYWQFLSIPYAKPPVGRLKFQPPRPVKPWMGVKSSIYDAPLCVQFDSLVTQAVYGQEDCLYANVYLPPIQNDTTLPVLLYFHSGGFIFGGSQFYKPDYLMDYPIIVVTFNYRLGPFGFLNFNHDPKTDGVHLPRGNMGLKDQLLMLKWVQNNIASLGGDPSQVTIFGDSAGGVSVHWHVLSPKSRGLFHRAFTQSGTAFSAWAYMSKPREVALEFAKRLGCPTNDTRMLLDCLEDYDPLEMVKYQVSSTDPALIKDNLSPSIEAIEFEDRFVSEHPQYIMDSENFSKVPYILGVNSGDGGLRTCKFDALPGRLATLQNHWTEKIANVLLIDELSPSKAEAIQNFYFDLKNKNSDSDYKKNLTDLFSDFFMFEPVHRAAVGHSKTGAPTYLFYYNYTSAWLPGSYPLLRAYNPDSWVNRYAQVCWGLFKDYVDDKVFESNKLRPFGVGHAEELSLIWNFMGSKWFTVGNDVEFSKTFVNTITRFVQSRGSLSFGKTVWPDIIQSLDDKALKRPLTYMLIDNRREGKLVAEPFEKRIEFWKSLEIEMFNRPPKSM